MSIIAALTLHNIGRIEYLHTDGEVREFAEYNDEDDLVKAAKEDIFYGVPIRIVFYADAGGCNRSKECLKEIGGGCYGLEIIPEPSYDPTIDLELASEGCSIAKFTINGKKANADDFGKQTDLHPERATLVFGGVAYECGDRGFLSIYPTKAVLSKYDLALEGYWKVCDILEDKLHIGGCDFCN